MKDPQEIKGQVVSLPGWDWKKFLKHVVVGVCVVAGLLLSLRLLDLLMMWGLYSWFFQSIIRVGGINEYIAGATSIWFTAVVLLLLPIALSSFLFRRQVKSLLIISACFSLWFVILYFLSQPKEGEYFNAITGTGRVVWFKNPQGKIGILPLGYKFDPHYGIKTQLITPPVVIDYEKQVNQERQEAEKKVVVEQAKTTEALRKKQETVRPPAPPKPQYRYKQPVFIGNSLYDRSFRIEILSAEQEQGSRLKIDLVVRYQLEGVGYMRLEQPEKTAYIVDAEGNRYGFLNQEKLNGEFLGGVDVRGSMTFLAPTSTVRKINVLFQYTVGAGRPCAVIFRNLDLDLMKLVEPVEDDSRTREFIRR